VSWLARFSNLFRLESLSRDLDDELRHHFDMRVEERRKEGMTEAEAIAVTRRAFGNYTSHKENMRTIDIAAWIDTLMQDARYAVRQLIKTPAFTIVAVLTLGLGIGANTAIFTVLNEVLLKPLPVPERDRFVILTEPSASGVAIGSQTDAPRSLLSYEEFEQLRARNHVFESVMASSSSTFQLEVGIAGARPEPLHTRFVSGEYFPLLGAIPAAGQFFTPADERGPGTEPFAVVSYRLWQQKLGGQYSAIGSSIRIQGKPFTIVGVTPRGLQGETVGESPDLWLPLLEQPVVMAGRNWLRDDPSAAPEKAMWLHAFARLKPGVTLQQAQAGVDVMFAQILDESYSSLSAEARKRLANQHLKVASGANGASWLRAELNELLWILLGVVGLVLLIACANIANLLLARSAARQQEFGVRLALGAGRYRIVRQLLTESLILAVVGAVAGLGLAYATRRLLVYLITPGVTGFGLNSSFDWRVLVFTALISVATALLFGLAPALRGSRVAIGANLKDDTRGSTASRQSALFSKGLVVVQVALSVLLVISAGLFLRTLDNLRRSDLGYPTGGLIVMRIDGLSSGERPEALGRLYAALRDRVATLPGVTMASYSENGLFSGSESADEISVEGFTPQKEEDRGSRWDAVGPGYFSTVRIPMLLGREITEQDSSSARKVCVINEAFAKRFFANRNPIGMHVTNNFSETNRPTFEIIGVAGSVRDHKLRGDVPPRFYVPVQQGIGGAPPAVYLEARTTMDTNATIADMRRVVQEQNDSIQISRARSVTENLERNLTQEKLSASLSAAFGGMALLLAAIGLYGVLAYGVTRRTNEIGVRMALGARAGTVVKMVLRETGLMVGIGLGAGVLLALAAARLVQSRLYGLQGSDPLTILTAVVILTVVALAAGYVPARRAARIDPATALRHE
jgi:predicted permease